MYVILNSPGMRTMLNERNSNKFDISKTSKEITTKQKNTYQMIDFERKVISSSISLSIFLLIDILDIYVVIITITVIVFLNIINLY